MNYVQITEEMAREIHALMIESVTSVGDRHIAKRYIELTGDLAVAISNAKPLSKKPGPKSKEGSV